MLTILTNLKVSAQHFHFTELHKDTGTQLSNI